MRILHENKWESIIIIGSLALINFSFGVRIKLRISIYSLEYITIIILFHIVVITHNSELSLTSLYQIDTYTYIIHILLYVFIEKI